MLSNLSSNQFVRQRSKKTRVERMEMVKQVAMKTGNLQRSALMLSEVEQEDQKDDEFAKAVGE